MRYIIDSIRDKLRRRRMKNKTGELKLSGKVNVLKKITKEEKHEQNV